MAGSSLTQLDIFAQMVASGSVAVCARNLGMDMRDIERDLASLEMRLGYRLFDDLTGVARLTPAGHKTAQAMTLLSEDEPENWKVEAPDSSTQPPPAAASQERQSIILAAPAPVFGHFQEALAAFEAANDDIEITLDLTVQLAEQAAQAIRRGTVDIAYFYAVGEPGGLPSRYGWSEQISLYAGVDHPLARREIVTSADLAITPYLTMEPDNGLRRIIDQALTQGGVELGAPALETDNLFDIVTILREGAGYFAAFGPLARDLGRMAGIRRLALESTLPTIQVRQAIRNDTAPNPVVEALAEYLFR